MAKKKQDAIDPMLFSDDKILGSPKADQLPAKPEIQADRPVVAFAFGGVDVPINPMRLVLLTAMHKANGAPPNKDPRQWRRKEGASFIEDTASALNVPVGHIWKSTKGKNGGTWAHWQIALAYAKYLSHEFHRFVNDKFKAWAEEEVNPALKAERADRIWQKRGKSADWRTARMTGIPIRNELTSEMKKRLCKPVKKCNPYREVTEIGNIKLLGKPARDFKKDAGANKSDPARDHASVAQLVAIQMYEVYLTQALRNGRAVGNEECVAAAYGVANAVQAVQAQLDTMTGSNSAA